MANKALYNLVSGLVLDRAVFSMLPIEEMDQCIANLRAAGDKPLCIVSSADEFFTHKSLFSFLQAGDSKFALVNEGMGGFLSEEQVGALLGIKPKPVQEQVIQALEDAGDVVINMHPQPGYVLAPVPVGWSVNEYMSLGPTKIKRKMKNADGDGTMFYMHPDQFYKMWTFASRIWAGELNVPNAKIDTGVGAKMASVQDDRVSLGGNYIRRYEIEQVAKHRGWAFPDGAKIAA